MKSAALPAHTDGEEIDLATSLAALTTGSLEIRIGSSEEDILASQALRYRIFYEEMSAKPSPGHRN
mgnify:CR=1 FL=1